MFSAINIPTLHRIFNFCYPIFNFQTLFHGCNIFSNLSENISYNLFTFFPPCISRCCLWASFPDCLFVLVPSIHVRDDLQTCGPWLCTVGPKKVNLWGVVGWGPSHSVGDLQMSKCLISSTSQFPRGEPSRLLIQGQRNTRKVRALGAQKEDGALPRADFHTTLLLSLRCPICTLICICCFQVQCFPGLISLENTPPRGIRPASVGGVWLLLIWTSHHHQCWPLPSHPSSHTAWGYQVQSLWVLTTVTLFRPLPPLWASGSLSPLC